MKLHLARLDLAEKRIGRIEFLREMRRGANLRSRAMAMIGTYSTVSAHAFSEDGFTWCVAVVQPRPAAPAAPAAPPTCSVEELWLSCAWPLILGPDPVDAARWGRVL